MMAKLEGRVALITGGGRGIGGAIATALAGEGARLAIASRTASELDAVAKQCRSAGVECETCVADVSDMDSVRRLVDCTVSRFQRVDILVNAAGIYGPIGPIADIDPGAWLKAIQVNLMGTFYACRFVLPTMIAQGGGKIINFSGGGSTSPLPRFSAYGVSKTAIVRLTETLAEEVKPCGITANVIAPGAVDTRIQDDVLKAGEQAGELYARMREMRETGTGGTPIAVPVQLVVFLASSDSDGLTGRLISAPHDPWREWDPARIRALDGTPWYTLRRIDPFTIRPLQNSMP